MSNTQDPDTPVISVISVGEEEEGAGKGFVIPRVSNGPPTWRGNAGRAAADKHLPSPVPPPPPQWSLIGSEQERRFAKPGIKTLRSRVFDIVFFYGGGERSRQCTQLTSITRVGARRRTVVGLPADRRRHQHMGTMKSASPWGKRTITALPFISATSQMSTPGQFERKK